MSIGVVLGLAYLIGGLSILCLFHVGRRTLDRHISWQESFHTSGVSKPADYHYLDIRGMEKVYAFYDAGFLILIALLYIPVVAVTHVVLEFLGVAEQPSAALFYIVVTCAFLVFLFENAARVMRHVWYIYSTHTHAAA